MKAFLVELRGVDDLKNDDHIEVGIYSTAEGEVSLKAANGSDVTHQTFTITPNPRWRANTTARIVDGALMSESIPVLYLSRGGEFGAGWGSGFVFRPEFEFRDVRLRLTLHPDGTFTGVMGKLPTNRQHLPFPIRRRQGHGLHREQRLRRRGSTRSQSWRMGIRTR